MSLSPWLDMGAVCLQVFRNAAWFPRQSWQSLPGALPSREEPRGTGEGLMGTGLVTGGTTAAGTDCFSWGSQIPYGPLAFSKTQ